LARRLIDRRVSPFKNNVNVTVLEADPIYVGGISAPPIQGFYRYRRLSFLFKIESGRGFVVEILPNDMLDRPRFPAFFMAASFSPIR
jgi:hypothetical protein